MRVYANLIQNLALFDLPKIKYDQIGIFKRLLIYDHLPDDNFDEVLSELDKASSIVDPAFSIFFNPGFEKYILSDLHRFRWQKIQKDHHAYTQWEIKRRNKENPYFTEEPNSVAEWQGLPNFSRQKKNRPYQFDLIYKDAQFLAGMVYELTKNYQDLKDKDLFRARVNSIMLPNKIILASSGRENTQDSMEGRITTVNIKISLDAYKLADLFLERLKNSLHKIIWSYPENKGSLDSALLLAESLSARIRQRIGVLEKNFILYLEADYGDE